MGFFVLTAGINYTAAMLYFQDLYWRLTLPVKITFTAPVSVFDHLTEGFVREPHRLRYWHGKRERGLYLYTYLEDELSQLGLRGGDLRLLYDTSRNELRVVTTFVAKEQLSPKQLRELEQFTVTFWGDGGGENVCGQLQVSQGISFTFIPLGRENEVTVEQKVG